MKIVQEKSDCCRAKIIRYGGKRRQCTRCQRTWRVHPAKRGRKPIRHVIRYLEPVFRQNRTVCSLNDKPGTYKRFGRALQHYISCSRTVEVPDGPLTLVVDAAWQTFDLRWTEYFLGIKSIHYSEAHFIDPVLLLGRESAQGWKTVLSKLSSEVISRVVAVVCDGIRGMDGIADANGWAMQRCHFHLLKNLQVMRGKRASTHGRAVREEIYKLVRHSLREPTPFLHKLRLQRLAALSRHIDCPKRMGMIVREYLRHESEYRTYRRFPSFNLPITSNVMESLVSRFRNRAGKVRTPYAWHRWAVATIRNKPKFTCNGANYQPN